MNLSGLHRKFVLNGRDTLDPTKVTGPTQLMSLGYIWESVPGIDTDGVSTANADQGTQKWIYIRANALLAAGTVVGRRPAIADYVGVVAVTDTPAMDVVGVAQYEILGGEYGFILREGITTTLTVDGATTDGVPLVTSDTNAGQAMDWVASTDDTARIFGITFDGSETIYRIDCRG